MYIHYTILLNFLIHLINNGHLLYGILCAHLLKFWLSYVVLLFLHTWRTGPAIIIIIINDLTWKCMQSIGD